MCEPSGLCKVFEYDDERNRKVTTLSNPDQRVVTNQLVEDSQRHAKEQASQPLPDLSNASKTDGKSSANDRYRIAEAGLKTLNAKSAQGTIQTEDLVKYLFEPLWIEDFTKWNIIYEPKKFRTRFRTSTFRNRFLVIDGNALKHSKPCSANDLGFRYVNMLEIAKDAKDENIAVSFAPVTAEINEAQIREGLRKVITPTLMKQFGASKGMTKEAELVATFAANSFGTKACSANPKL